MISVEFTQWDDGPSSDDEYGSVNSFHVPRIGELVSIDLSYPGEDKTWSPATVAATSAGYMRGRVQDIQYHVHPRRLRDGHNGTIDVTVFLVPIPRTDP